MPTMSVDQDEVVEDLLLVLMEKLGKGEFDLPPLPQIANQVLAVTADPQADASKLTALIEQDPILAAKIFQTSNSVVQGSTRKIDSLQQAIAWLGLNTVAGTAFTLLVQSGIFNVQNYEQEVKALWMDMMTSACYAKSIAGLIGGSPDAAFLSGLLHAIGKPPHRSHRESISTGFQLSAPVVGYDRSHEGIVCRGGKTPSRGMGIS